jgi:predicted SAM-dependent methyltransferase
MITKNINFLKKRLTKNLLKIWYEGVGKIKINNIIKQKPASLHIACGRKYKLDWINIDEDINIRCDAVINIKKGIPVKDNSVKYIYNEHFIEHLSYKEGFQFMKECYRILEPGGVLRIACPDLDLLIDSYIKDYWKSLEWVKLINAEWYPSRGYMINQCMQEDGQHKYIYNIHDLTERLKEAGFSERHIYRVKIGESDHSKLQGIDTRADSLIVEAKKSDD